jgi:hypothetical protein
MPSRPIKGLHEKIKKSPDSHTTEATHYQWAEWRVVAILIVWVARLHKHNHLCGAGTGATAPHRQAHVTWTHSHNH